MTAVRQSVKPSIKPIVRPKRACGLYVRVSTEMQANIKEGSLETQLSSLTKYTEIKTNNSDEDWFISKIYREEGKSGKNTDRPEYQRMINEIKEGKIDVLLCTKIDRVHRSLVDFYKLHELLEQYNVTFVSLSENWDTSTPMGRFGLKLTLAVAELEREQTSQRTKEKMQWRAEEGLWNGGQVLGYDVDPEEKGILKINQKEALVVKMIFKSYLEQRSFRETAKAINSMGYRTKYYESRRGHFHGNKKFLKTTIACILQNPIYIGELTFKDKVFKGKQDAIIDKKLWKEVNNLIASNRVMKKGPRTQNMHAFQLDGLVRCGWCGNYLSPTYSRGRNQTYAYYQCTSALRGADECKMKRVSANALENVISNRFIDLSSDNVLLEKIVSEANSSSREELKIIENYKDVHKKTLLPIDQKIRNIVQFISQGNTSDIMASELTKLEAQKNEILIELNALELDYHDFKDKTVDSTGLKGHFDFFSLMWQTATHVEKKDLLRTYIHKIIWYPDKIRMGLYNNHHENQGSNNSKHIARSIGAVNGSCGEPAFSQSENAEQSIVENRKLQLLLRSILDSPFSAFSLYFHTLRP